MSDETRTDATARLNLVRDSWGPYPAQVVFWLPSWGLVEFRRLAPDLFDWRSNLTVLHDADLPVRDEEEYLVWVAERHGRPPSWPWETSVVAALRALRTGERTVFLGYGAAERDVLLRHAAWDFAAASLSRRLPQAKQFFSMWSVDLDLPYRYDAVVARSPRAFPAPAILRAPDISSCLDPMPGWTSVARAAGIPGAETAARVLAAFAEANDLLVLLDGVDRLDLRSDGPALRFLTWLSTTPAQIAAFVTDEVLPPPMNAWHLVPRAKKFAYTPEGMSAQEHDIDSPLSSLLAKMFDEPEDLVFLATHLFGPEVSSQIQWFGGRHEVAADFVRACQRHGLLDEHLFADLKRIRPRFAQQIDEVARAYLHR